MMTFIKVADDYRRSLQLLRHGIEQHPIEDEY
jgi:hypothetical protein